MNIFTDGSTGKEGAGCGIYLRYLHSDVSGQWLDAIVIQTGLAEIAAKDACRHTTGKSIRITFNHKIKTMASKNISL